MNPALKVASFAALALVSAGCFTPYAPPIGVVYTSAQVPNPAITRVEASGPGKSGDKMGEACATSIGFIVAFGDASLDAAKKAGSITEVHSVEIHGTSILGLYMQHCTEVHGR